MNKTEKLTRVKFITKWWNRVGTVDVDYESKKLGEMFADLDQLLQAEREAMFLNMQYYMEFCLTNGYITPQDWITNQS